MHLLTNPPDSPVRLETNRCLLFAYGQLQPGQREPHSASRAWPDRVRGLLYDLGPYPAACQVGSADRWFHGFVMEIDETELVQELDRYEELEQGTFRRVRVTTVSGFAVWVYEYARPLPAEVTGPIDRWLGPGTRLC